MRIRKPRLIAILMITVLMIQEMFVSGGFVSYATETEEASTESQYEIGEEDTTEIVTIDSEPDDSHTTEITTEVSGTECDENSEATNTEEITETQATTYSEVSNVVYYDLNVTTDTKLTADKTVKNLTISNGKTLDLNGYNLTILGDCNITKGTISVNSGEMYCQGNLEVGSKGELSFGNANSYVLIDGDTKLNGTQGYSIGTLECKGDFTANEYFKANNNFKVIFSGTEKQIVNVDEEGYFAYVELQNYSPEGIYVASSFQYTTLVDNDCVINYADLAGERGFVLEEDVTVDGMYYLLSDTLDLNGHTMTINGDFVQGGGYIHINGGQLIINGDYRVQTRDEVEVEADGVAETQIVYSESAGTLKMDNEADYVFVQGDYINNSTKKQANMLTAGVMEIQGDVSISKTYNTGVFLPSENCTVVLSGETAQTINVEMYTYNASISYNHFNNLELKNTSEEGVTFVNPVFVSGTVSQDNCAVTGGIILGEASVIGGNQYTGDIYLYKNITFSETTSIYGNVYLLYSMTLTGNLNLSGDICDSSLCSTSSKSINFVSGTINIDGDVSGVGLSAGANTYISVFGYANVSSIGFSGGTIELKGDLNVTNTIYNNKNNGVTGKLILSGSELQTITGANKGTFGIVELQNYSEEGIKTDSVLLSDEIISNGCRIKYGDLEGEFGWILEEDLNYNGNFNLFGDELNLNGHTLTVSGDFLQASGSVDINGGTLVVEGSYIQEKGELDINGGSVTIKGDYRMQKREGEQGNYTYSEAESNLNMKDENDKLLIYGDFVVESSLTHYLLMYEGITEVKGNITIMDCTTWGDVYSYRNHITLLSGDEKQIVDIDSDLDVSGFKIENSSEEGVEFTNYTYIKDYFETNDAKIQGKLRIKSSAVFKGEVYNGDLYIDGAISDDLQVNGDLVVSNYLLIEGDVNVAGEVRSNGPLYIQGELSVEENFYLYNNIEMRGGKLNIIGDALFESCCGKMTNSTDYIYVGGNLTYTGDSSDYLTNGIIEVGGDLTINSGFSASGSHKVILSGTELQTINVAQGQSFNILELQNYSEEGVFAETTFGKNQLIRNGCNFSYGDLEGEFGWTLQEDTVWEGDLILLEDTLDLNGYSLTVKGSFTQLSGDVDIDGGKFYVENGDFTQKYGDVNINGGELYVKTGDYIQSTGTIDINGGELHIGKDYRIQTVSETDGTTTYTSSTGSLIMDGSGDYVKVSGDFYQWSTVSGLNNITSGTLEVQGDINIDNKTNKNVFAMYGDSTLVMSGGEKQAITTTNINQVLNLNNFTCKNTGTEGIDLSGKIYFNGMLDMGEGTFNDALYVNDKITFVDNYYKGDVILASKYNRSKLKVDGNVKSSYLINSGELEITGDFTYSGGYTGENSKIILSGDEPQTINSSSGISVLELRNTSEAGVYSEDYLRYTELIKNDSKLTVGSGDYQTGITLTEDTTISGDYLLGYGTLDLNGYTLTVEGDLIFAGGVIDVNRGTLIINGDYIHRIRNLNNNEYEWVSSYGTIKMDEAEDTIEIKGNAEFQGTFSSSASDTYGTIRFYGDLSNYNSDSFSIGDNCTVELCGDESQTVGSNLTFSNLIINNDEGIVIKYPITVTRSLEDISGNISGSSYITIPTANVLVSDSYSGNLYITGGTYEKDINVSKTLTLKYSYNNDHYLNGHEINADTIVMEGTVNVNGGTINCKNNLTLSSNGKLIMSDPNDYISVGGDMKVTSSSSYTSQLTSGTLELKGDMVVSNTSNIQFGGDHKTLLTIKRKDTGRAYIQNINLGTKTTNKFNTLVLQKTSDEYVFNRNLDDMANEVLYDLVEEDVVIQSVTNLSSTYVGVDAVTIEYTYPGDKKNILGYELYRDGELIAVTSEDTYTDIEIDCETEYTYEVYPIDPYRTRADSSPSVTVVTPADNIAPSVPEGLAVKSITGASVTIEWLTSTDNKAVTGYEIYRDGAYYATVEGVTEYKDTAASVDESHSYQVLAFDEQGNKSALSENISAMGSYPQITKVTPTDETSLGNGTVNLKVYFANLGDDNKYNISIEYYDAITKTWFYVNETELKQSVYNVSTYYASVNWDVSSLPRTEYDVKFVITDEDGYQTSRKVTYYIDNTAPLPPMNLATISATGAIDLAWDISPSIDCQGYKIHRRVADSGEEYKNIGSLNNVYADSFTDKTASSGVIYEYAITAYDEFGNESDIVESIKVQCEADTVAPVVQSASPEAGRINGTTKITASVTDNCQVTSVRFEYKAEGDTEWTVLGENVAKDGKSVYSWNTANLADGAYYINMVAIDAAGNESVGEFTRRYEVDNTGISTITINGHTTGATYVQLRWDDVLEGDFAYFAVEQYDKNETYGYKVIGKESNVLGYNITNLAPNTQYRFRVVGYDDLGNRGKVSSWYYVTTLADTTAPVITQIYPVSSYYRNTLSLGMEVKDDSSVAYGEFYYSYDKENFTKLATVSGTGKSTKLKYDLSLSDIPEGSIYIKFIAYDKAGNRSSLMADGNEIVCEYRVDKTAPAKPNNFMAYGKDGYIELSWDGATDKDISHYKIYRASAEDDFFTVIDSNHQANNYYDTNIESGASYIYKIVAVDIAGNTSIYSEECIATASKDITAPEVKGVYPSNEYTVGTNVNLYTLVVDNAGLDRVIVECKSVDSDMWITICDEKISGTSYYLSKEISFEDMGEGWYDIRVRTVDKSGNSSPYLESTYFLDATAPKSSLVATSGNFYTELTLDIPEEEDFSYFEIYRRKLPVTGSRDGYEEIDLTNQGTYIDEDVTPYIQYEYKVYVYDIYGNYSVTNSMATCAYDKDEIAPTAILPERMRVIAGREMSLDGGESYDNVRIDTFTWDMGNGDIIEGRQPVYTYDAPGTYTVTLSAKDAQGNEGTTTTTVEVLDPKGMGTVDITVTDTNGIPIPYAYVYVNDGVDSQLSYRADYEGKLTISAYEGEYSVGAYKNGYIPKDITIDVSQYTTNTYKLKLPKGDIVVGEFNIHRMDIQEIVDSGVDLSNPSNLHNFTFELTLGFAEMPIPVKVIYIGDKGWSFPAGGFGTGDGGGGGGFTTTASGGLSFSLPGTPTKYVIEKINLPVEVEEDVPILTYIKTSQSMSWLKDMYMVELGVMNIADSKYVIEDSTVTLHYPLGLSLAMMSGGDSNSAVKQLGSIAGQQRVSTSWIITGDSPGEYEISAYFTGILKPFGCNVTATFQCEDKIQVGGYKGLKVKIMPEGAAYAGEDYYIQFAITNETGRPLYNFHTSLGEYTAGGEKAEIYIKDGDVLELYDSAERNVYVIEEANDCSQTVILSGGDTVYIPTLENGQTIYGTYVTEFTGEADPQKYYYGLVEKVIDVLEGEDLGVDVTISPIPSHITKEIYEFKQRKGFFGDPVDITSGAYLDEYEALFLKGETTLSLDLSYDSTLTTNSGDMGYGWSHNFETHLLKENGRILYYIGPDTYATFVNEDSLNNIVYGRVEGDKIIISDDYITDEITYKSISTGLDDYTLTRHIDGSYTMSTLSGYCCYYDSDGRLTGMKTDEDCQINITYADNQAIVTEPASGKRLILNYSAGKLISVSDDTGRSTYFAYSGDYLTTITNPVGEKIHYSYDSNGRLVTAINNQGAIFVSNVYDENGRVITQYDAYGNQINFSYTEKEDGLTTLITDAKGNQYTVESNIFGGITSISTPTGADVWYAYDDAGNLATTTDSDGNTYSYTYDAAGRITGYVTSAGENMTLTYDEAGNLITMSGEGMETSYMTYDSEGHMTSVQDGERTITYGYNENGRLSSCTIGEKGTEYYTYGENGRISTITDIRGYTTSYQYDSRGNTIKTIDGSGAETSYEYDQMNRVTGVVLPNGGRISYTYNQYNSITSETDPLGNTTTYTYDTLGRCTGVTLADGTSYTYGYDATGNITSVTYPDGTSIYYEYNSSGNCTGVTYPDGTKETYTYDSAGRITSATDTAGVVTRYTYEGTGKLDTIELPDGQVFTPTYGTGNQQSMITSVAYGQDASVTYSYDNRGQVTTVTDATGSATSYHYGIWGELLETEDALGNKTTYTYDVAGNCTGVTYPDGSGVSYTYDAMSRPLTASTKVTDILTGEERTVAVSYTYDSMGNIVTYTDAEGNKTYYEYDLNCQLIKVTDSQGVVQAEYTYDSLGRILQEKTTDGIIKKYTYNVPEGIIKMSLITPTGEEKEYVYTYDNMGRLQTVTDPTGVTTSQTYTESGDLESIVYPQGGGITYGYDEYGRLVEEKLSIGTTYTYEYNAESNVAAYTNGRGQETTYTYDKAGRITGYTDELGTVTYSYDANGNVVKITEINTEGETKTIQRTYDCMNRVATYTDYNGKTVKYGYDELGNIVSLTYAGGEIVRYSYTDNGLLEAVVDGEGYKTSYTYDSSGRLLTTENPDGTEETNTYDSQGRLASTTLEASGEELYTISYTYDQWGNILTISCEGEGAEDAGISTLTPATMTYDESNRMLTYNGEDIIYDQDGNMTYGPLDGEMTTFEYDCRNRLVRAGDTTYEYDAEDVRIAVETPEYRDEYVTDTVTALSRVLEVERLYKDSNTSVSSIYYYGNGLIYEKNSEDGLLVYHYDHLGSTKAVTNENGNIIAKFSYGTYGELLTDKTEYGSTLPEIRFLYNGELGVITDDNSLYYMRARYYNPQIKRFINQDILTGNIGNNKSLNRYSYVEGNPVSYTDPFGLSPYQKISEGIHTTLEALGSIPGVGNFFDWVNVGYYVLEGNLPQAFQATIYAMPYGDLAKLKKYAPKVLGLFGGAEIASHMLQDAGCDNIQTIFSSETRQYSHFGEYEDTSQLTTEESLAIALDTAMLAMNITSSFKTPVNWKVDGGDVNVGKVDGGSSGYKGGSSSNSRYIPMDADGNPIPLNKQRVNGQDIPLPDPDAQGRPHTVLGSKISSETGEIYLQSATFPGGTYPSVNGYDVPWSEVHWTDHGTPHHHTSPHQHVFEYNTDKGGWIRREPTPYYPKGE